MKPTFDTQLKTALIFVVSLAVVLCLVTQRSSPQQGALRDETQNGCEGDYNIRYRQTKFEGYDPRSFCRSAVQVDV